MMLCLAPFWPRSFWIVQIFPARILEQRRITPRFPLGHVQVLIPPVAAFCGGGPWNIALKGDDPVQHFPDQGKRRRGVQIPFQDQLAARPAAHRSEVDDPPAPFPMGAEEGGPQMLQGVQRGYIDDRLLVRLLEAEIEGRQYRAPKTVFAGNVEPRFEPQMINLKTRNLFHVFTP